MGGSTSFNSGFVTGFIAAFVLLLFVSTLWNIVRGYIAAIKAADKPQTVVHTTTKTPNEVVDAASAAKWKLRFLWVVLYIAALIGLELVRPGTLKAVLAYFGL